MNIIQNQAHDTICLFLHIRNASGTCATDVPIMIRICKLKPCANVLFTVSTRIGSKVSRVLAEASKSWTCCGDKSFWRCDLIKPFSTVVTTASPIAPPIKRNCSTAPTITAIHCQYHAFSYKRETHICPPFLQREVP